MAAALLTGGASGQSQFSCLGAPVTIEGTQGDDTIVGTEGDDVIYAFGGNDVVDGRGGNDLICVSEGINVAEGGPGDDRIEGGPQDDLLVGDLIEGGQEIGRGDDDLAGGTGADAVVGDSIADSGFAGGEGDDRVRGGEQNDVLIGDAFSGTFAVGIGEDDLQGGTGTDITVGDAMVGTPAELTGSRMAKRQGSGPLGAFGSGGDRLRTQTESDLLIGGAANFVRDGGAGRSDSGAFLDAASSYCGAKLARQIIQLESLGFSDEEIEDIVLDTLIAEFFFDVLVGDCFSAVGKATGGGPDRLNGGTEGDLLFGGGVGEQAIGDDSDKDALLGGKGDDCVSGDSNPMDLIGEHLRITFVRECETPGLSIIPGGRGAATLSKLFRFSYEVSVGPPANRGAEPRGGTDARVSGGGADEVRGGQGNDGLEGGPKRDKCSGGPGTDQFVTKGPFKCEEITGDP